MITVGSKEFNKEGQQSRQIRSEEKHQVQLYFPSQLLPFIGLFPISTQTPVSPPSIREGLFPFSLLLAPRCSSSCLVRVHFLFPPFLILFSTLTFPRKDSSEGACGLSPLSFWGLELGNGNCGAGGNSKQKQAAVWKDRKCSREVVMSPQNPHRVSSRSNKC